MFVRKVETSKKVFPKNIYRKTISIDKDGVCIRRAGEPDAAGADGHGRDDDERVRLRSGEPADLVGRYEQRGEPAVDERDVCVQRAYVAKAPISIAVPRVEAAEKEKSIPIPALDEPAVFPMNPYQFQPRGLVLNIYNPIGTGKNGGVFKWTIPGTSIAIFEWNEDYLQGSHYHAMLPEWSNRHVNGIHYLPGEVIPEPWQSMFF